MASSPPSSSTTIKIETPGEAGSRAAQLLKEQQQQQQSEKKGGRRPCRHGQQDTFLSHAGVAEAMGSSSAGLRNLSLAPPLEFATTYTRPADGEYLPDDAKYTRMDNPTRVLLERTVSQLECTFHQHGDDQQDNNTSNSITKGTEEELDHHTTTTCAFASGMMAASSIILAHPTPLTVLLPQDLYHGVSTVLTDVFAARFGVTVKHVTMHEDQPNNDDDDNHDELSRALDDAISQHQHKKGGGSIVVWMETPSNPCLHVVDIAKVCDTVHQQQQKKKKGSGDVAVNITTVVDSTMAPPVIQQPLKFGADLVLHSGTKYFGGHSDVLLGLVTASPFTVRGRELAPVLRQTQCAVGGVASPMDSWLTLRGMRTLHLRVHRQCETALVLAKHLFAQIRNNSNSNNNSLVTAVHYPGLESHPRHDVAKRQMKLDNFGGVLSVELKSEHAAMAFAGALQTIYRATSLGGTETLIEHRASIEPPERVTSPPGLLRISVGLEDPTDLIADIDNALAIARQVDAELA